ncbi:outer membrane lipoprotein carrier protein LolA [Planctomycetota bacterium]
MNRKTLTKTFLILALTASACRAPNACQTTCSIRSMPSPVENILNKLNQQTEKLGSYQAQIEYFFKEPLLDSVTVRKGNLYYRKFDTDSKLTINFDTVKYDDEDQENQKSQYIFDGKWLTVLDYQNKSCQRRQLIDANELSDPNKPANAFDILSNHFPLIGFTETRNLKEQFEITIIESAKENQPIHLLLKVKPDSIYKEDYKTIDFWIDPKLNLPVRIMAVSIEGDIYEIKLLKAKVNKKMNKKVFDVKVPKGFSKPEIIPLEKIKD